MTVFQFFYELMPTLSPLINDKLKELKEELEEELKVKITPVQVNTKVTYFCDITLILGIFGKVLRVSFLSMFVFLLLLLYETINK